MGFFSRYFSAGLLAFAAWLAGCSPAAAASVLKVDTDAFVPLVGEVMPPLLPAAQIIDQLSEDYKDIYILVNGPGGSVVIADVIINAIEVAKSRGVVVHCFTGVMAMSADFSILSHCSRRYALARSLLMFHPVRTIMPNGASVTANEAGDLHEGLDEIDQELLGYLCHSMMNDSKTGCQVMANFYYKERLWKGLELSRFTVAAHWLEIVDDIRGVPAALLFNIDGKRGASHARSEEILSTAQRIKDNTTTTEE